MALEEKNLEFWFEDYGKHPSGGGGVRLRVAGRGYGRER